MHFFSYFFIFRVSRTKNSGMSEPCFRCSSFPLFSRTCWTRKAFSFCLHLFTTPTFSYFGGRSLTFFLLRVIYLSYPLRESLYVNCLTFFYLFILIPQKYTLFSIPQEKSSILPKISQFTIKYSRQPTIKKVIYRKPFRKPPMVLTSVFFSNTDDTDLTDNYLPSGIRSIRKIRVQHITCVHTTILSCSSSSEHPKLYSKPNL